MSVFKGAKNLSAKLQLSIMRRLEEQNVEGDQRLLVVVNDGQISNIFDANKYNLVPADDARILRSNLRLMSRQAAVMSGDDSRDVMQKPFLELTEV